MQLSDLLPTSEQLIGIQGVEKALLQRRRTGTRVSTLLALLGALLQIALIIGKAIPISNFTLSLKGIGQILVSPEGAVLAFFLAAVIVYTTIRYTGFLFKESRDPFRYTFDIKPFTRIDATPAERYSLPQEDYLKLLHVDLMERLNRRIKRLSLLEDPSKAKADDQGGTSGPDTHIHIEGHYAIREEKAGGWALQVLPEVRIGPDSNPSTLAYSIRHPLARRDKTAALSVDQFEQLTERIYSSIATEIYRQIKNDVESKIGMFPTDYLRAVARYCEARDFENSNTIDSYDRALELYRTSIHAFDVSATGRLALSLTRYSWFRAWRWVRPALQAEARARLGYARCMIYRRIVSELAGRDQNPLFEIRRELQKARDLLIQCYNSLMPARRLRFPLNGDSGRLSAEQISLDGILEFPDDKAFMARRMEAYQILREELCETYAVSALGCSQLADTCEARKFLDVAESLRPGEDSNRALILLSRSFVDGDLWQRIAYLRRAKELAPESEIVSYRLAVMLDMLGRSLNEISLDRIDTVRREYESVLKINPGNVSCLIGQGYLSWLVEDLDTAENAYSVADDLKDMVSQTFVGDLKYGRARVAAERAAQSIEQANEPGLGDLERSARFADAAEQVELARRSYAEAVAADPAVAACYDASTRVKNGYFSYICDAMLERYRKFKQRLVDAFISAERLAAAGRGERLSMDSLQTVRAYALNDYGAACFNYYLRFDLRLDTRGRKTRLEDAIGALKLATGGTRANALAPVQYNLAIAYAWRNDPGDAICHLRLLKDVLTRFPNWLEALRTNSRSRIFYVWRLLYANRDKLKELSRKDLEGKERQRRGNAEAAMRQTVPKVPENPSTPKSGVASAEPQSKAIPASPSSEDVHGDADEPSAKVRRKRHQIERIEKLLIFEQQLALDRIFENTLLYPIRDEFDLSGTENLASKSSMSGKRKQWDRLGDSEALALGAWVQVLGFISIADTDTLDAGRGSDAHRPLTNLIALCKHYRAQFYAEDYSTLTTLILTLNKLPDPQGLHEKDASVYERILLANLAQEQKLDPSSQLVGYRYNEYCSYGAESLYAKGNEQFQRQDYLKAAEYYSKARDRCPSDDRYHADLALAIEYREKQLLEDKSGPSTQEDLEDLRARALSELERAIELDPDNADYRERHLRLSSRQWVIEHGLEQALNAYQFSDRMEIQVAESLVDELFTNGTLKAGLQVRITELREKLERDTGVVLPGVRFRDNRSFADGQCKFLIRDIPTAESSCVGVTDSEKWGSIVAVLERVAGSFAAEYFGPQDAITAMNKLDRSHADLMRMRDDPDALGAATIVLKGLLNENVPIAELAAILSAIETETTAGTELLAIQEHIRSFPKIRKRLPGNSPKNPIAILRLGETLEREISGCIDRTWGAAILDATPVDFQRWRGRLITGLSRADRKPEVGILAGADVRPFLRALTQVSFPAVPVLSEREILTPLLVNAAGEIP